MLKIFISTGEVSGDLQGSLLVKSLHELAHQRGLTLEITALGGEKMAAAGTTILGDTTGIGSVGILEHLAFIGPTLKVQKDAKRYLQANPPDIIVLIDYIGPNMGIGTFAKKTFPEIPVFYYIAPQEWVWSAHERNTMTIVGFTDQLLAVFPEEAKYYAAKGAKAKFVGHPLVDRMAKFPLRDEARATLGIGEQETAIALIPASRQQELKFLMPSIFAAAQQLQVALPNVRFWVPLSRQEYRPAIEQAIQDYQLQATVVADRTDEVLAAADLAIAKCGTVSLELALLKVPQVVIYKVGKATAWIAEYILRLQLPFMSPTNLIEMKPIIPELMQDDANPDRIVAESLALLQDPARHQKLMADYEEMRTALGEGGVCARVAAEILDSIVVANKS